MRCHNIPTNMYEIFRVRYQFIQDDCSNTLSTNYKIYFLLELYIIKSLFDEFMYLKVVLK